MIILKRVPRLTSPFNLAIYEPPPADGLETDNPARVTLEQAQASFALLGKGLSDKYLKAKPLDHAPDLLANPRRPIPFSDGKEIYLPAVMDFFDSRSDNWRVYRLYACIQAEQWEAGTFQRPSAREAEALIGRQAWMDKKDPMGWIRYFLGNFPLPLLAAEIFLTLETARVALAASRRFKGLAADLAWFLPRLNALAEPLGYGGLLWSLFFTLLSPRQALDSQAEYSEIVEAARVVASQKSLLKDSLKATLDIYRLLEPRIRAIPPGEEGLPLPGLDDFFRDTMPSLRDNRATKYGRSSRPEEGDLIPPELAEVLDLDFMTTFLPMGVGEYVTQEALGKKLKEAPEIDVYQKAKAARRQAAAEMEKSDLSVEKRLLYPEWDYLARGYRRNWTTLYQLRAGEGDEVSARRLLQGWDEVVREVCSQFRMLRYQERSWRKRLEFGEEIDIQQAVEREVDIRCGLPPTDKIYMEKRRVTREVSALFLLDLSASTSSQIEEGDHQGETVLQVLVASVAIMARALEQLGDRYGVYGFSGYGRDRVEFLRIKSFNEPLGNAAWRRLAGLKPMKSTRMGAAVRHAHHLLDAEPSTLKLMLLLSDGYPQDFDYGDDRTDREYGLRDTAQSLREAEADHILPFCVTVDAAGHDYLRRMCPPQGYLVLNSVEDLPSELPKVYLRLREL